MIKTKSFHTTRGRESISSSMESSSSGLKKSDRLRDHIGKAVVVDNCGGGTLRYFDVNGDVKICGVELDEPNGDCNGEDLDGNAYFKCADNHGIYVSMKEVTMLDEHGDPIVFKKKAKPKKKFESPPSLRKKIVRKNPSAGRASTGTIKSKNPPSKNTASGVAHQKKMNQGARKKVDHLAKTNTGLHESVSHLANADRKIIRRAAAPAAPAVNDAATADDEALPALDDDVDGADNATAKKSINPVDEAKFSREMPTDWLQAAKEKQKEAEEAASRERELADLAAQEERLKEAEAKQAAQEEEFNRRAMEAARKRDEMKLEQQRRREAEAAARAAAREEKLESARQQEEEFRRANEEEQRERDEKEEELQQQRLAQKARIAALMSRVKGSSRSSTPSKVSSHDEL